jgi:hypothetical protein
VTLLPIEHATRLASPAQAAALFRALGARRVSVKGWNLTDRAAIDRVVGALVPGAENTVSFERGTLTAAAWAALEPLAGAGAGYFDLNAAWTQLRIWPERAWVLAPSVPDVAAISRVVGAPLAPGENRIGATRVTIGDKLDVETTSAAAACAIFRAIAGDVVSRGFVMGANPAAKLRLPAFLAAVNARVVTADLWLSVDLAAELATGFPHDPLEWQAEHAIVRFPEGSITTYRVVTPTTDREKVRRKALARIDKALRRARIA